ncbi:MAG: TraB/GumN family protein [Flavisolibacter sp.]|nr:TraB/GumN family protein [Flavisolibacter sp.]
MKKSFWLTLFAACGLLANSFAQNTSSGPDTNTLLWRVSGKNLSKPTYIFGTMHMICASDIELSDSLKKAIRNSDNVYLELDMDNMWEMFGAMMNMNMKGDTTLSDLLSPEDYKKVKDFFKEHSTMVPFAFMEKFKPMLVGSLIMEQAAPCDNMVVMEKLVMDEANKNNVDIKGLETFKYQLGIFDKIPYKLQAQQLVKMVDDADSGKGNEVNDIKILTDAYRNQELAKLDELTKEDPTIGGFADILLYDRNANWVKKLQQLMPGNSLVIAVGAGHLPGKKGVLNLLREAGYKVEPVKNEMIKKKGKEI